MIVLVRLQFVPNCCGQCFKPRPRWKLIHSGLVGIWVIAEVAEPVWHSLMTVICPCMRVDGA